MADTITGRTPGETVEVSIEREGAGTMAIPVLLEPAPRTGPASHGEWLVNNILQFFPLGFLVVAAFVLLQRPQDRHAWLLALMFASFIAAVIAATAIGLGRGGAGGTQNRQRDGGDQELLHGLKSPRRVVRTIRGPRR